MAPSRAMGHAACTLQGALFLLISVFLALPGFSLASKENATEMGLKGAAEALSMPVRGSKEYLRLFMEETEFFNRVILFFLPESLLLKLPHVVVTWMRNMVAAHLVYFIASGLWALYIYSWRGTYFFDEKSRPRREDMLKQIGVTLKAMPFYTCLPTFSEWMVEQGWTLCYANVAEVGWPAYFGYQLAYLFIVEVGVYWMHRWLHDVKFLYDWLHRTHHVYNKQHTLSPFAGLAFHPLDGILQASPNVIALFLVPTHFLTHLVCLFVEGIWTTNIHDCIDGRVWMVMGAGYHTIHHTTYRHNYGHYTIFMDWLFGTLQDPEGREPSAKYAASKKSR